MGIGVVLSRDNQTPGAHLEPGKEDYCDLQWLSNGVNVFHIIYQRTDDELAFAADPNHHAFMRGKMASATIHQL